MGEIEKALEFLNQITPQNDEIGFYAYSKMAYCYNMLLDIENMYTSLKKALSNIQNIDKKKKSLESERNTAEIMFNIANCL